MKNQNKHDKKEIAKVKKKKSVKEILMVASL